MVTTVTYPCGGDKKYSPLPTPYYIKSLTIPGISRGHRGNNLREKFNQKCSGKVFNDDPKNQEKLTPTTNKEKKADNIVGEETRQLTGRREVETADWVKEK
jgi:hypothetical protein